MGCSHFYEWEDCPACNPNPPSHATREEPTMAAVKTTEINRWEVALEGNASTPTLSVNSIDGDEKNVKVRLNMLERIISVEDWLAFVNGVAGKIKQRRAGERS